MGKLNTEEIVTLQVLKNKGESNRAVARQLDVSESVVRYHLKRKAAGATDGRVKASLIEQLQLAEVVDHWWKTQIELLPKNRSPSIQQLHDHLKAEHDYSGSYKSVRKYVRATFEKPKLRAFRRIETPPGAQTQSDWMEINIDIGAGIQKVYGFVMTLSHSRKSAVIWSLSMDQLAWQRVHNEAFGRLGGVAAINRIDNLKTGVAHGSGARGKINESYAAYARTMGFHVDPHEVRQPQQKGKVERKVRSVRQLLKLDQSFESLEAFQQYTDQQLENDQRKRQCPVTGKSIHDTWLDEQKLLRALPSTLPEPFNLIRKCEVQKDATIRFEGRTYSVPFGYIGQRVEVRGCSGFIQIMERQTGEFLLQYPRNTAEKTLVCPTCYEGESTERVAAPKPLGQIARALEEIAAMPVQQRSIEIYERIAGLAK